MSTGTERVNKMLTRKWMRAIIFALIVYALARICLRMKEKNGRGGLNSDFEFAALVREKSSGAKKRIPPDSNYTDASEVTRQSDAHLPISDSRGNENINASDMWRSRKFADPGAFDLKGGDAAMDATLWKEATNHSAPQIEQLRALFSQPWKANREAVLQFRKQLQELKASVADIILTKNNTSVGQKVRYALNRDLFANITQEIYEFLPQESPFQRVKLPHCSVVGNGGILLGSRCGPDIDEADFIFRCNMPRIKGFEMDAGVKSNFTTINAVSTLKLRYHFMQSKSDSMKFTLDAQRLSGYLWMPIYGLRHGLSYNLRVAREVHARRGTELARLRLVISNPDHFSAVQDFWAARLRDSRISTGFYLVTLALSMCDETHLYGFWPFAVDLNLRPAMYHYYDKTGGPTSVHSFTDEFDILMEMHRDGQLRLHVDQCT